jgi:hypothetical protein
MTLSNKWMKYRVTYRQRFDAEAHESDSPEQTPAFADGVVLDAEFLETIEPPSTHGEERIEEDDGFLGFGSTTWVYDVADGRDEEFKSALAETERVLMIEPIENTPEYVI